MGFRRQRGQRRLKGLVLEQEAVTFGFERQHFGFGGLLSHRRGKDGLALGFEFRLKLRRRGFVQGALSV